MDKPESYAALEKPLKTVDVSNAVDPSKSTPAYTSGTAYFRLCGMGRQVYFYQYSNDEFLRLSRLIEPCEHQSKKVHVLFNNLVMLDYAMHFIHYLKTFISYYYRHGWIRRRADNNSKDKISKYKRGAFTKAGMETCWNKANMPR